MRSHAVQLEILKRQKYRKKAEESESNLELDSNLESDSDKQRNGTIITSPGALKLKEGSRYSIEFGVNTGISKYRWHLPLDRQVRLMKSQGLICTSQVLFQQVDTIAWYLQHHFMPKLIDEVHRSKVHQGDETYWENLGKGAKKRFWLWSVKSGRAIVFEVFNSRTKAVAKKFLKDLKGILLTDGFQAYQSLANADLLLANDWCHVRRKFIKAEKTHSAESLFFVNQIRMLFDIEEKIKNLPMEEKKLVRDLQSKPITEAIYSKCLGYKTVLPQSPLGKAVQYTLKLWPGLTVFLSHPELPIHTNDIERAQRSPVIGRKNHCGSKSLETAETAAIWYSLIATCELNQVQPNEYLLDVIQAILTKKSVSMPWEWTRNQVTSNVSLA